MKKAYAAKRFAIAACVLISVSLLVVALLAGIHIYQVQNNNPPAIDSEQKANSALIDLVTDNNDMQEWPTYENEQYGFVFRYPGEWKVSEAVVDTAAGSVTDQKLLISVGPEVSPEAFTVSVDGSFEKTYQAYLDYAKNNQLEVLADEIVLKDSTKGRRVITASKDGNPATPDKSAVYFFARANLVYKLESEVLESVNDELDLQDITSKIVRSFDFY